MDRVITPAPFGLDLALPIECTALPTDDLGDTHLAVVHSDWTVTTSHDLESEKIARALGGWSSCLHFVETTVPAYRHVLTVMHEPLMLSRDIRGKWLNTTHGPCRHQPHHHASLRDAVRHEISAEHVAAMFESSEWRVPGVDSAAWSQYFQLIWVAREVWAQSADPDFLPLGPDGYMHLWKSGILPEHAERIAAAVPPVTFPLPPDYLIGAYYNAVEHLTYGGAT